MAHSDDFWKLEHLPDAQLLESLSGVLRAQRRALAELVAHLAEVEDRRLHLEMACSSMFGYCVGRLGMSEDEACRRIDLARLARTFPALFAELESARITLSVALVLKPVLTPDNHRELLHAARGKSTQQARELVAGRFPKADVPSSIRKLPERRPLASEPAGASALSKLSPAPDLPTPEPSSAPHLPPPFTSPQVPAHAATLPSAPSDAFSLSPAGESPRPLPAPRAGSVPASRGSIEPLSAQRYRIQFTADAELKRKLELARDLLRHAHPSGDFAPIVARALDLLLDDVQRRRFGVGTRRKSAGSTKKPGGSPKGAGVAPAEVSPSPNTSQVPSTASEVGTHCKRASPTAARDALPGSGAKTHADASAPPSAPPPSAASDTGAHADVILSPNASQPPAPSDTAAHSRASASANAGPCAAKPRRSHIPRAARRAVLERDGLGCSWVDAHGVRCGSRAWLELDHRQPHGKGGNSEPDNVRLLCRAHNRLAAEHAYGRAHLERASSRLHESNASVEPRSRSASQGARRVRARDPATRTPTTDPATTARLAFPAVET